MRFDIKGLQQQEEPGQQEERPAISFIVITHEPDADNLARMIDSLPTGVEVCIVQTRKGDKDELTQHDDFEDGGRFFRFAEWTYVRLFNFARARNHSAALATNDWVFWIDSDDILPTFSHEAVLDIPTLPPGVGGVECGCFGIQPAYKAGEQTGYYHVPHLRAYRKSTGAKWQGLVHEQILPQIEQARFTVVKSTIMVAHMGYVLDRQGMIAKVERNIELLSVQLAHDTYCRDYYQTMLKNQLFTLHDLRGE